MSEKVPTSDIYEMKIISYIGVHLTEMWAPNNNNEEEEEDDNNNEEE